MPVNPAVLDFSRPTLDLIFDGRPIDGRISTTRASTGFSFDSTGTLVSNAINAPRIDYDPVTLLPKGLLIEPARVNWIKNNAMTSAAAGTPGVLPTNWSVGALGTTTSVIGSGQEQGIYYVDLRFFGTTSSAGQLFVAYEGLVTASSGQVWTGSAYYRLMAGDWTNVTLTGTQVNVNGGTGTTRTNTTITSAALCSQRVVASITAGASTTSVQPFFVGSVSSGVAVDFTIRIGMPQLESGLNASSPIRTTSVTITRNLDIITLPATPPWFTGSLAGTLVVQAQTTNPSQLNTAICALEGVSPNATEFRYNSTGAVVMYDTAAGVNSPLGTPTQGSIFKAAYSFISGAQSGSMNGATPATGVLSPTASGITNLTIGGAFNILQFGGWIYRLTYYPKALSRTTIQALARYP